jgi:hypothetical protein
MMNKLIVTTATMALLGGMAMAQDVVRRNPDAVMRRPDGLMAVDYKRALEG